MSLLLAAYRPPSAVNDALSSLYDILNKFNNSEFILLGDLNWDWLAPRLRTFSESYTTNIRPDSTQS